MLGALGARSPGGNQCKTCYVQDQANWKNPPASRQSKEPEKVKYRVHDRKRKLQLCVGCKGEPTNEASSSDFS